MKYKCKDHLGNEFSSMTQMAKHWGISNQLLSGRLSKGWDLEKALTTPNHGKPEIKTWTDHEGNTFSSMAQMAKHWNLSWSCVKNRLEKGIPLKDALTTPPGELKQTESRFTCQDHKGNKFRNHEEMCSYWDISVQLYHARRYDGWDMKRALETPSKRIGECIDHTGKHFDSRTDMLNAWGISAATFKGRMKAGWPLEKILTTPARQKHIELTDPTGKTWPSKKALCEEYDIDTTVFQHRIDRGWSMQSALETPSIREWYKPGTKIGSIMVVNSIFDETAGLYYACQDNDGFEDLYSHQELCEMETA